MYIVGDGYYGKVDQVPGLFHVKTRFVHVYWAPLLPRESYLFLDEPRGPEGARGVRIPFSTKSVLLAWARIILFLAFFLASAISIVGIISLIAPKYMGATVRPLLIALRTFALGSVAFGLFYLYWSSYRWSRASPARAKQLGALAGIPPERIAEALRRLEKPRGGRPRRDAKAGGNVKIQLPLTRLEAEKGTTVQATVRLQVRCPACEADRGDGDPCPLCNGRGTLADGGLFSRRRTACSLCLGSGTLRACPGCDGSGFRHEDKRLSIAVPAGSAAGTRLRIPGKGNEGTAGMPPGDLFVVIDVVG